MKAIQLYIKEGLKITSKTKVSKSGEDIKTLKEFILEYQNQINAFTDKAFSVSKKSELYDKLNNVLEIILDDHNSSKYNNLITGIRDCNNGNKYKLNIIKLQNNFKVYCHDDSSTKMIMSIERKKEKIILVKLIEADVYKKEYEEALIEGLKYMVYEVK